MKRQTAPSSAPIESTQPSLLSQSKLFAEEQWNKAHAMLERNPSLMTGGILVLALKRRAPVKLVRFMLKLNPNAASIPKQGPSPLQIAVQSQCPIEVVEEVIRACPFALVATNPGSHLDPLSYAKRFRPKETDLIRLLSHPVNHWISEKNRNGATSSAFFSYKPDHTSPKPSDQTSSTQSIPPFLRYTCGSDETVPSTSVPYGFYKQSEKAPVSSGLDLTELNNVKLICLATLKGHKRLSREMMTLHNQLEEVASASSAALESASSFAQEHIQMADITKALQSHSISLLGKVREQQQEVARAQLVALDTKDQAMRSLVQKTEHRVTKIVQKYKDETAESLEIRMNALVAVLSKRLNTFSGRIDALEGRLAEETRQAVVVSPEGSQRRSPLIKKKKKSNLKSDAIAWKTAAIVSPESFTYREGSTIDTFDDISEGSSPMPFVYATPFKKLPTDEDDARSLLTDDSFVSRPTLQHRRPSRRAMAVGKRLLLVLCKN